MHPIQRLDVWIVIQCYMVLREVVAIRTGDSNACQKGFCHSMEVIQQLGRNEMREKLCEHLESVVFQPFYSSW